MQVQHDDFVVVVDGEKMLLLRNQGDAEYPHLEVVEQDEQGHKPPPTVVDKGGILVIRTVADQPWTDILREERQQRLDQLWEPDQPDLD